MIAIVILNNYRFYTKLCVTKLLLVLVSYYYVTFCVFSVAAYR